MKTRLSRALVGLIIGLGLSLAAPAAWAQATSFSSFIFTLSGNLAGGSEAVACTGPVKVSVMVVKDPSMAPNGSVWDFPLLKCDRSPKSSQRSSAYVPRAPKQ